MSTITIQRHGDTDLVVEGRVLRSESSLNCTLQIIEHIDGFVGVLGFQGVVSTFNLDERRWNDEDAAYQLAQELPDFNMLCRWLVAFKVRDEKHVGYQLAALVHPDDMTSNDIDVEIYGMADNALHSLIGAGLKEVS